MLSEVEKLRKLAITILGDSQVTVTRNDHASTAYTELAKKEIVVTIQLVPKNLRHLKKLASDMIDGQLLHEAGHLKRTAPLEGLYERFRKPRYTSLAQLLINIYEDARVNYYISARYSYDDYSKRLARLIEIAGQAWEHTFKKKLAEEKYTTIDLFTSVLALRALYGRELDWLELPEAMARDIDRAVTIVRQGRFTHMRKKINAQLIELYELAMNWINQPVSVKVMPQKGQDQKNQDSQDSQGDGQDQGSQDQNGQDQDGQGGGNGQDQDSAQDQGSGDGDSGDSAEDGQDTAQNGDSEADSEDNEDNEDGTENGQDGGTGSDTDSDGDGDGDGDSEEIHTSSGAIQPDHLPRELGGCMDTEASSELAEELEAEENEDAENEPAYSPGGTKTAAGTGSGRNIPAPEPNSDVYTRLVHTCQPHIQRLLSMLRRQLGMVTKKARYTKHGRLMGEVITRAFVQSRRRPVNNIYQHQLVQPGHEEVTWLLLVDLSGSVSTMRAMQALTIIAEVAGKYLKDEDFAVMVFGSEYAKVKTFTEKYQYTKQRIGGLRCMGGTNMHAPLEEIRKLFRARRNGHRQVLVIYSDFAVDHPPKTQELIKELQSDGVEVLGIVPDSHDMDMASGMGITHIAICERLDQLPRAFFQEYVRLAKRR